MKGIKNILNVVKLVAKYAGVVMVFVKTIDFLREQLEDLDGSNDESKE